MSELDAMRAALRESQTVPTKREAGIILAEGGWAIFPLPNYQKFDQGLSYLNATRDPAQWDDMCAETMAKHECIDVNIALAPGFCAVPLIVVDLDGTAAIQRFFDDAVAQGHIDVSMWLRVNTTRPDHGRHIYFVSPDGHKWSNSSHIWGGEVRSGKGHVVMPPSTTEHGKYTWVGEKLYSAPDWVVKGLRGNQVTRGGNGDLSDSEIEELLDDLSAWNPTGYGRAALNNLLDDLTMARPGDPGGGRNPLLAKTMNRVLDLAVSRDLNALQAIEEVAAQYETLFSADEGRNPVGEIIRCVRSWVRNHETAKQDAGESIAVMEWAMARGGGAVQEVERPAMSMDDQVQVSGVTGRVKRVKKDWKRDTNK